MQAAEAGVYSTQVSITAEVARNYFELRGSQQRLEVAQRNAENQRETLRITTARPRVRVVAHSSTRHVRKLSCPRRLATIPDFESEITRSILRLGVLTGKSPEALIPQLSAVQKLPTLPTTQNIGTPELLLRRRPDIKVAERAAGICDGSDRCRGR